MPTHTIHVARVSSFPVQGGQTKYWIYPVGDRRPLETLNPLKASLCQRAKETGVPALVTTRETRWGFELVSVALEGVA